MNMPGARARIGVGLVLVVLLVLGTGSVLLPGQHFAHHKTGDHVGSMVLGTSLESNQSINSINLIRGDWRLGNVTLQDHSLLVQPSGLYIVKQNGSPGQLNPPVNLFGTSLETPMGFRLDATLTDILGRATLSLYGAPPLIEDELRAEEATLDVTFDGQICSVVLSRQPEGVGIIMKREKIPAAASHTLTLTDNSGFIDLNVDAQHILRIPDHQIFDKNRVWFGLDTSGHFTVPRLVASGKAVSVWDSSEEDFPANTSGLSRLATKRHPDFLLGASVAPGPMVSDQRYRQLLSNFNAVTTENICKFQAIHPQPDAYDFTDMDAVVAMAHDAGMSIHGHTLVFGESNPAWVQAIAQDRPDQLQKVLTEHITTVVSHYRGQVQNWDVVNEPLADYDTTPGIEGLRKNIWYRALGPGYIATALRAAHSADSQAGLWINEFGLEADDKRFQAMIGLVTALQAQHVPLTGIGFQAHIDPGDTVDNDTHIDTNKFAQRLMTLQNMGLKARFSEVDVSYPSEYPVFADIVTVCLKATNCTGVTLWGATDRYSSSGSLNAQGTYSPGIGLPWDEQEQPSPALAILEQALKN